MTTRQRVTLMDADAVDRALPRMAREIVERNDGTEGLVVLGIQRRGVELASGSGRPSRRRREVDLRRRPGHHPLPRRPGMDVGPRPVVGESNLPMEGVDDRTVVVVDDVLFTGRTARAAMNELMDWGRPARILLCVLVDRGGRELPIQPDIVGRSVGVLPGQQVEVRVPEEDGRLAVELVLAHRRDA
jgi:pyrimidine operon attenuation protein / uracil phosphoribosyltransferase